MAGKKNKKKPAKPDLVKKPLPEDDKESIRQTVRKKVALAKETLTLKISANNITLMKAGAGVGDIAEYIEEFTSGFEDVFKARGVPIPEEWKRGNFGGDKKHAPRVYPVSKHYGVIPQSSLAEEGKNPPKPQK